MYAGGYASGDLGILAPASTTWLGVTSLLPLVL
jgi:hypothetical protein